jgi:hypothetical protein
MTTTLAVAILARMMIGATKCAYRILVIKEVFARFSKGHLQIIIVIVTVD